MGIPMRTISLSIVGALLLSLSTGALAADQFSSAVVFTESGFPAADAAGPSAHQFAALLPGARFTPAGQLATLLKERTCNFSSAFSACSLRATSSATELTSKKNAAYGMR